MRNTETITPLDFIHAINECQELEQVDAIDKYAAMDNIITSQQYQIINGYTKNKIKQLSIMSIDEYKHQLEAAQDLHQLAVVASGILVDEDMSTEEIERLKPVVSRRRKELLSTQTV